MFSMILLDTMRLLVIYYQKAFYFQDNISFYFYIFSPSLLVFILFKQFYTSNNKRRT